MRPIRTVAALAMVATLIASCSSGDDDPAGSRPGSSDVQLQLVSSLERFDSCDQVRTWAHDELAPRVSAYGFNGGGYPIAMEQDMAATDGAVAESAGDAGVARTTAPVAPAPGDDTAGAPGFSETNVQVEGVDEPDIVKTDGERILAISDGRLHLTSAAGAQLLDSIDLPEGLWDGQMLLDGDRVLVFGNAQSFGILEESAGIVDTDRVMPPMELPTTRVVQVDIADGQLTISDTFDLDGSYISARMTGDVVRLAVHADPQQRLPFVTPAAPNEEAEARAKASNQEVVEQAEADTFLPTWRQLGSGDEVLEEGSLVGCEQAHAPETFAGFGMVAVVSIDLSDGLGSGITSAKGAGVMAGGQTVYSSAEHLYVAAPEWVDWETMTQDDQRVAAETHGTDIHRFDITDPTQATYEMSGHVEGELLNQFAMDEHEGNLRVATTTGAPWVEGEGESESQVAVLAPGDGALAQVGLVSGLGRGETIHSVRFLGAVGYVVTFEQTDPLYTVDLSDPANPRVSGELKILGYSAYLHPIGDGRLIGVGQDATEEGRQLGTQVALFDVRDPAAPTRIAQATVANANSGAEWDSHAFLWWADANLVAIPLSVYDYSFESARSSAPFEGLIGYSVDIDGAAITERGRISHPSLTEPGPVPLPIEPDTGTIAPGEPAPGESVPHQYTPPILRSLVIDNQLWTLSSAGLASSDLATLGSTTFIPFA